VNDHRPPAPSFADAISVCAKSRRSIVASDPGSPRSTRLRWRNGYPAPVIVSIKLGSLFLTLPTRGLTGQATIFSDG
jgi:hypothetical protein